MDWVSDFFYKRAVRGVMCPLAFIQAIFFSPLSSQDFRPDPIDDDDLRDVLTRDDLQEYLHEYHDLHGDTLMFDIRFLPGFNLPPSIFPSTGEDRIPGNERAMMVDSGPAPAIEATPAYRSTVIVRSTLTRSDGANQHEATLKERSIVRWDMRDREGAGSFGEMSVSTSGENPQLTSMTWQLVGREDRWEVALGSLSDRSSHGLLEHHRRVNLRDVQRALERGNIERMFSKPSYRNDVLSLVGMGARMMFGSLFRVSCIVGTMDGAENGRVVGKMSLVVNIDGKTRFGIGAVRTNVENTMPMIFADARGKETGFSAELIKGGGAGMSTFIRGYILPLNRLRISIGVWDKSIPSVFGGVDRGCATDLRWRIAPHHAIHVCASGGSSMEEGGSPLRRSFVSLTALGRPVPTVQWNITLRELADEISDPENISFMKRREVYISTDIDLSGSLTAKIGIRSATMQIATESAKGSSLHSGLRYKSSSFGCSVWAGSFDAEPGITLWSSHPGYLLWPVGMTLSGGGVAWGCSALYRIHDSAKVAAYVAHRTKDKDESVRSSILLEMVF